MIVEFIVGATVLMVALSVALLLLKIVFSLAVLPFKLLGWMVKSLLGLVVVLPLLVIGGVVLSAAVPLLLVLVVLPLCLLGGGVLAVVRGVS